MQLNILGNIFFPLRETKFLREIFFLRTKFTICILCALSSDLKLWRYRDYPVVENSRQVFVYQKKSNKYMLFRLPRAPPCRRASIMAVTRNKSYCWKDTVKIKQQIFNIHLPNTSRWVSVRLHVRLCACPGSSGRTVSLGQCDSNLGWYCLSISPATGPMKYNPLHCSVPQVLICDNEWTFPKNKQSLF